jgi:hypothetical protein
MRFALRGLRVRFPNRLSIHESLSSDALDRERSPRRIVETERRAVVVPEIEFAEIPL